MATRVGRDLKLVGPHPHFQMKLLLTNDDGIDAPGLQTLHDSVVHAFGDLLEVVVVAPDRGRSECGHGVTSGRPLRIENPRDGWYSTDGTPVDCVRAALSELVPDADVVLSGVNNGANLGVNLLVSGTFAAAREAAFHGIDAMAVSHYRRPDVAWTWNHVPTWLRSTLTEFVRTSVDRNGDGGLLWNVNLPASDPEGPAPDVVRCDVDSEPLPRTAHVDGSHLHFRSNFHERPRRDGFDVERCFAGSLTISEMSPRVF